MGVLYAPCPLKPVAATSAELHSRERIIARMPLPHLGTVNRWVYRCIEMDADKQVGLRGIRDAATLGERHRCRACA